MNGSGFNLLLSSSHFSYCLVDLLVQTTASEVEDSGFESRLQQDFSGSSHTSDFKIGTPVATLPGVWRYGVNTGTGCSVSVYCDSVR